ncbi:MAG TPA: dihydropteroate synthase [Candidatus Brocadiia bacterium]|nr:dihydropteroate synthase [Candidatus Brocadiia bacterium]
MLIVAERINATRKRIGAALAERDAKLIVKEAKNQAAAGAAFIDINAGADPAKETEDLVWMTRAVQGAVETPLCFDSASPEALSAALDVHSRFLASKSDGRKIMINSINGEKSRLDGILPLVVKYEAEVVALAMDEAGMPTTAADRVAKVSAILEAAAAVGVPSARIYADPCIQPVSTDQTQARAVIDAIRELRAKFPELNYICGLSNVSFGLPQRRLLNRTFLVLLMGAGLNAAVLDPTEPGMMSAILAAEALLGQDEWCMQYITASRDGKLDDA